jgi:DNA repair exonuclease SbcCD ATPase subunit
MGFILALSTGEGGGAMILKSLRVQNWGCLVGEVQMADFAAEVNLIYGPNGSGKSTLMDALARGLFDRYKMQSAEIQAKQPWDTSLAPEVAIEFQQNGEQYRLEKRFLSGQRCDLQRQVNGEWEPFADGDKADDRLMEILQIDRPGRGATRPEHWGIAQLLWLPQGQFWLPEDGLNEKSRNQLQQVLSEVLITPRFHAIESQVQKRYDLFFTPTRANLKKDSEPRELEDQLETARRELGELQQRWDELDELNQAIMRLRSEHAEAEKNLEQKKSEHDRTATDFKQAQQRSGDRKAAEAEYQIKESAWKTVNDRVRGLQQVREDLSAARGKKAEHEKAYQECEAEVEKAKEGVSEAKRTLDEAEQERKRAGGKVKYAQDLVELAQIRRSKQDITEKLEQLDSLSEQRKSLETQLQDLNAPSHNELVKLRRLNDAVRDARARLEASSLLIQFRPQMQILGTVSKDGEQEPFSFTHEEEVMEWRAVQSFDIEIRGVGHFSVSSGSGEAQDLKSDLDQKEREFHSAIEPFGAEDLEKLSDRNAKANAIESEISQIRSQESVLSRGSGSLNKRLSDLEARQKEILESYMGLEEDETSEEKAAEARREVERELADADQKLQDARRQLTEAQDDLRDAERNQERINGELTRICTSIEEKESQERKLMDDGLTDSERQERRSKALDEFDQARQRLERIPPVENLGELETMEKRLAREVAGLEGQLRSTENSLIGKRGELHRAEGEGLYSRLAKAEEQVTLLESKYQSALTQANSVKLLRDTLDECRQEALEDLVIPVSERVTQAFQRIAGENYAQIQLSDGFAPEAIAVRDRDAQVNPDFLSYGTREQLNILVRVTLGKILAESQGQRQLVILDDPLAHTDPERHQRMLELLHETAEQLQLIILTCRPGEYVGLGAKGYDLEELKSSRT